jgi:hypothetical protein
MLLAFCCHHVLQLCRGAQQLLHTTSLVVAVGVVMLRSCLLSAAPVTPINRCHDKLRLSCCRLFSKKLRKKNR